MNEIINENKLFVVKEYEFDNPLIQNINSIIDKCYRDCHNNYYHTFKYECVYDINFRKITNNETVNLTIVCESMAVYELIKNYQLLEKEVLYLIK